MTTQFYRLLRTLNPRRSLRAQAALVFGALTILLAILISFLVERIAQTDLQEASGNKLAELAYYLAESLDRDVYTRYQDLELLSLAGPLSDPNASLDSKQHVLARFQEIYPHYTWVGLADLSGQMVTSVGDRPGDNETVATLPWFVEALRRPYVGDLYTAVAGGDLAHYVTIAIPVIDANGQQTGILGTYLEEGWIQEIETSLLQPSQARSDVNIMALTENGRFLFGSADLENESVCISAVPAARSGDNGYLVNTRPDDKSYLVGYARTPAHPNLSGPGWLVLACQEAGMALAPVQQLQQRVLLVGSSLSILFLLIGWVIAGRMTSPITAIARAANRLRRSEADAAIPVYESGDEVGVLSKSLHELVSSLAQRTGE
ncbi:MAG: cache and HAMP domain-containing protein, partial [Anaerolineales bacterium]|nr:cache and HAMP domain-containing protein [Anaerolineales bacterium]